MRNLKRSLNAMAFFAVGTVFYLACQGSEAVNASAKYQGICAEQHGLMRGWFGPVRTNYADAQGDAAAHTREFGHATDVLRTSSPSEAETGLAAIDPVHQGLHTYRWSGRAIVKKKSGQRITLTDGGALEAPNYQIGSALCYNAFRFGIVERNRELADEVVECDVQVTGPVP